MSKKCWIALFVMLLIPGMLLTSCTKTAVIPSEPVIGVTPEDEYAEERSRMEAEIARIEAEKRAEEEARKRAEEAGAAAEESARRANESQRLITEQDQFENEPVYFDYDESLIKNDAREILKNKAEWLKKNPDAKIIIEGHCDERGDTEYNQALGESRAKNTRSFLVGLGISELRIKTVSYGEERPAVLGHSEEAWSKNRRAEFKIID